MSDDLDGLRGMMEPMAFSYYHRDLGMRLRTTVIFGCHLVERILPLLV